VAYRINSVKTKILAIAALSVIGFAGYLAFMFIVSQGNAARIKGVKDIDYPVLSMAAKNRVLLDNFSKTLEVSVSVADEALVDEAKGMAQELINGLDAIKSREPNESYRVDQLTNLFIVYRGVALDLASGLIKGTVDFTKIQEIIQSVNVAREKIKGELQIYQENREKLFEATLLKTNKDSENALIIGVLTGAVILTLVTVVAVYIAFAITKSLKIVERSLFDMSQGDGDLTKRIPKKSGDEIGDLVDGFNDFVAHLQDIVQQVISAVKQMNDSIERMSESVAVTSDGAQNQQSHIIEVVTAIEEMVQSVEEVAQSVKQTAGLAEKSDKTAVNGQTIVNVAISDINELASHVIRSSVSMQELNKISGQIGSVTTIIQDVAAQTNLLALNASIEAARAGDQGRGFAVVADEVRNLATRTAVCTKTINEIVTLLQNKSSDAVSMMVESQERAELGVQRAGEAGEAFGDLLESIADIRRNTIVMAEAAREQQTVANDISKNVSDVREITVHASQNMTKTSTAGKDLSLLAAQLDKLISHFKV